MRKYSFLAAALLLFQGPSCLAQRIEVTIPAAKLHFAAGDGDTYFLNNAVHRLQQQLEATRNPHSDATFQYGPGMPHCYTGGPAEYTMQENNATWVQRVLPEMVQHMLATAPKGADTTSWRY